MILNLINLIPPGVIHINYPQWLISFYQTIAVWFVLIFNIISTCFRFRFQSSMFLSVNSQFNVDHDYCVIILVHRRKTRNKFSKISPNCFIKLNLLLWNIFVQKDRKNNETNIPYGLWIKSIYYLFYLFNLIFFND